MTNTPADTSALMDQAAGLRRLFARKQVRFAPVVARPYLARSSVLMDQLCQAIHTMDLRALAVDASRAAGASAYQRHGRSRLAAERLSPSLGYLDVMDLPHTRTPDTTTEQPAQAFLHEVSGTMPDADVVLVHAATPDLVHLFSRHRGGAHAPRFMLLCDDEPPTAVPAHAALKLIAARSGRLVRNWLVSARCGVRAGPTAVARLVRRGRRLLGALQHRSTSVGPIRPDSDAHLPAMHRLTKDLLSAAWVLRTRPHPAPQRNPHTPRFF